MKVEPAFKAAQSAAKSLAKHSGECIELVLRLQFCRASQTLVDQLQSASTSLQAQYQAVQAFADLKIGDHDQHEPYRKTTEDILEFYLDVKKYADALVGVQKRKAKEAADDDKPSS